MIRRDFIKSGLAAGIVSGGDAVAGASATSAPRYRTGSGYWFIFRLDRAHWPRKGENTIEVTLTRRDPAAIPQVFIRDVELETKYLMGKNFHRGQDLDLGPYEHSGI